MTPDVMPKGALSGELTLTSYRPAPDLTYERWADEMHLVQTMARASMWWVGDLIAYGESRFGETYSQAVEASGLSVQTLMNATWVCRAIPVSRRQEALSFSHHAAVAGLEPEDQERVLAEAVAENLTEREVRAAARRVKNGWHQGESVPSGRPYDLDQMIQFLELAERHARGFDFDALDDDTQLWVRAQLDVTLTPFLFMLTGKKNDPRSDFEDRFGVIGSVLCLLLSAGDEARQVDVAEITDDEVDDVIDMFSTACRPLTDLAERLGERREYAGGAE